MALITKPFGDIFTFSRASAGGRFNAQGVYEMVPAGQPRIDYDPVTGECKGILIEEQRTNLCTNSDFLNDTNGDGLADGWGSIIAGVTTSIEDAPVFIGGKAQKITLSGTQGNHYAISHSQPVTKGATYTIGFWCWKDSSWNSVFLAEITGTSSGSVGSSAADIGQWTYVKTTVVANSTTLGVRLGRGPIGGEVGFIKFGAVDIQQGSFITSHIPTSGSQVTRAADVCSINTLSPWFNGSEGTLFVEVTADVALQGDRQLIGFGNGEIAWSGIGRFSGGSIQVHDGTTFRGLPNSVFSTGAKKVAIAFKAGETSSPSAINGVGGVYLSDGTVTGALTSLYIGCRNNGTNQFNGYIRKLRYYPKALSVAQLEAMTA